MFELRRWYLASLLGTVYTLPELALASSGNACTTEASHHVSFSTKEVTRANVDVSPDGKRIAFDLLGDIYVISVLGGKASRISGGEGWDRRPVWSPNGRYLAFLSDESGTDGAYVVDMKDGNNYAKRVSASVIPDATDNKGYAVVADPSYSWLEWLPDSKALLLDGRSISLETGAPSKLPTATDFSRSPHSGNGVATFVYLSTKEKSNYADVALSGARTNYQPYRLLDLRTPPVPLSRPIEFIGREGPSVSRNGRYLVYRDLQRIPGGAVLNHDVYAANDRFEEVVRVRDIKTGSERVLLSPQTSPGWNSHFGEPWWGFAQVERFAITADSKSLVIWYGGLLHRVSLESGEAQVIPIRAQVDKCLSPRISNPYSLGNQSLHVRNMRSMTMSPDGKSLAFSALRKIYLVNTSNNARKALIDRSFGQFQPTFSPDGNWIAFASWDDKEGGHVWRIRTDGAKLERLTRKPGFYQNPEWSPDGLQLAYIAGLDPGERREGFNVYAYGGELRVVSVASRLERILPAQARLGNPLSFFDEVTPSGTERRIGYASYSGQDILAEQIELHSIGIDGKSHRIDEVGPNLPRWGEDSAVRSPDGNYVAVVKYGNIFVVHCAARAGSTGGSSPQECTEAKITQDGGYDARWRDQGKVLEWGFGGTYHQLKMSEILKSNQQGTTSNFEDRWPSTVYSYAVNMSVPRDRYTGTIALRGANIVTMNGDKVINDGTIIISNGRIARVGPRAEIAVPQAAQVIDLRGKTILPGFIDTHAHIGAVPRGLLAQSHWEPSSYLAFGVTTARDPSNGGDHGYEYAELIEAGEMVGPRTLGATAVVPGVFQVRSMDDAIGIATRYRRLGASYLKIHSGLNRGKRRLLVLAARRLGMNVSAHSPDSNLLSKLDLSVITDGVTSFEHTAGSITDVYDDVSKLFGISKVGYSTSALYNNVAGYRELFWSCAALDVRMKKYVIPYTEAPAKAGPSCPEAVPSLPPIPRSAVFSASKFLHDGALVSMGSHGNDDGIGFHWEMWSHAQGAMTVLEVLKSATITGAIVAGVDKDVGSIEVGKIADLIILSKDPRQDIRNTLSITCVMKDGVLRDSNTLQKIRATAPIGVKTCD